ncbi:unnamed protein product, partial [Didymodactylos carnosus]
GRANENAEYTTHVEQRRNVSDQNSGRQGNNSSSRWHGESSSSVPSNVNTCFNEENYEYKFDFGDSLLVVKQGHISQEKVDAIIINVDNTHSIEPVQMICDLAGPRYKQACASLNPNDELYIMRGGELHARYIIHLPLPYCTPPHNDNQHYLDILHENLLPIFKYSTKYRINRIAISPDGYTRHKYRPEQVLEQLYKAYSNSGAYIRDIVMVIDDTSKLPMWLDLCKRLSTEWSRKRAQGMDKRQQIDERSPASVNERPFMAPHRSNRHVEADNFNRDDQQKQNKYNSQQILSLSSDNRSTMSCTSSSDTGRPPMDIIKYSLSKSTVLTIKQGDITLERIDVIVNAANEFLTDEACRKSQIIDKRGWRLLPGKALALPSGNLPSSCVIATVGPIFDESDEAESRNTLFSCYKECLLLATKNNYRSIAFPAVSCGVFGYPVPKAAQVAIEAVQKFSSKLNEVVFVLWEESTFCDWVQQAEKKDLEKLTE